jgi:hypothetical protein
MGSDKHPCEAYWARDIALWQAACQDQNRLLSENAEHEKEGADRDRLSLVGSLLHWELARGVSRGWWLFSNDGIPRVLDKTRGRKPHRQVPHLVEQNEKPRYCYRG